ncbi:hypothetical protein ACFL02_09545 [Planctomycetota bacterium]
MSHIKKRIPILINQRELATILAALRYYQEENLSDSDKISQEIKEIATNAGLLKPLNLKEVDELCERINVCGSPDWRSCSHQWLDMCEVDTDFGIEYWFQCVRCGATKCSCAEPGGRAQEEVYPPADNQDIAPSSIRGMTIEPPPVDRGEEPLWRAVYVIDVNAVDAHAAAIEVHLIMRDPDSLAPILDIIDSRGKVTRVDLSKDETCGKEESHV